MIFQSHNTNLNFVNGVGFLTFPPLSGLDFVNHAFSTRLGGRSTGVFTSMNLAFNRGDAAETVRENYRLFCSAAGFDYNTLVSSAQDHKTTVRCVTPKDCGIGIFREKDMESVDALVTNEVGVTLVTHYADCTPIYFADPEKKVIALAHAGWRGTVAKICEDVVDTMIEKYDCDAENMIAVVGPAIGRCCYEVDTPVYEQFAALTDIKPAYFTERIGAGKFIVDLKEANRRILLSAGLAEENIMVSDVCTKCNSGLLFSHRASRGQRGGLCAFMAIRSGR